MGLTNLTSCRARVSVCTLMVFASVPVAAADNFPMFRIKRLEAGSVGADLNNAGQATGYVSSAGITQAFLYSNEVMTKLGTLGGPSSFGRAINASGQVTGTAQTDEFDPVAEYEFYNAFLFSNGEMIDLGGFDGAEHTFGDAINGHGQVALRDLTPEGDGFAWLVSDGDIETRVFVADGLFGRVTGLNDAGYVTGYRYPYFNPAPCHCYQAFVGKSYDQLIELGALGVGLFSVSAAINAVGQIAGTSGTVSSDIDWRERPHAFLYTDGTMKDLGTLGGLTSTGLAINGAGKVTGFADTGSGTEHAFLWHGTTMRDLGTLGGTTSRGHAINGKGWVTGTSDIAGDVDTHAF